MNTLRGPADADFYRIKVGRSRKYVDLLDGDDMWEAIDEHFPSVTSIKPPFANQYVAMRTVADMPETDWKRLASANPDDRYDAIKANDRKASLVNMNRGTIVHAWAEDLIAGRPLADHTGLYPEEAVAQAELYRPALEQFFADYQPVPVAVEVPCFHRGNPEAGQIGSYAGTADLLCDIPGMGRFWIDWKSRKNDHGAYIEEAAQGGAYAGSEYMITVGDDGNPRRTATPVSDGVLIVSITKDSYKCFPIGLAESVRAFQDMYRWWEAQRVVKFQKPWAPRAAQPVTPPVSVLSRPGVPGSPPIEDEDGMIDREVLRARMGDLIDQGGEERLRMRWPDGVPPLSRRDHTHTQTELVALLDAVRAAEADIGAGWHPSDRKPSTSLTEPSELVVEPFRIFEGDIVDRLTKGKLEAEFEMLDSGAAQKVAAVTGEAAAAGFPVSVDQKATVRRWSIGRALVLWAKSGLTYDDLFTRVVDIAHEGQIGSGDDTLGGVLGKFSIEQADMLADWVETTNNK